MFRWFLVCSYIFVIKNNQSHLGAWWKKRPIVEVKNWEKKPGEKFIKTHLTGLFYFWWINNVPAKRGGIIEVFWICKIYLSIESFPLVFLGQEWGFLAPKDYQKITSIFFHSEVLITPQLCLLYYFLFKVFVIFS